MADCKPLSFHNFLGTKLPVEQYPTKSTEMEDVAFVSYSSAVDNLMYAIVYARPDIVQVMGVFSLFMTNLRCEHWVAMKRVFKYF
jgi:hypothetical protein